MKTARTKKTAAPRPEAVAPAKPKQPAAASAQQTILSQFCIAQRA